MFKAENAEDNISYKTLSLQNASDIYFIMIADLILALCLELNLFDLCDKNSCFLVFFCCYRCMAW